MVPQKLEETFSKYGDGSSLTGRQVWAATQGNRNVADPFGWIASKLEWGITWCVSHEPTIPYWNIESCVVNIKSSESDAEQFEPRSNSERKSHTQIFFYIQYPLA